MSNIPESRKDLFDYTTGRWVYNGSLRHEERRVNFDVDGLCRLAAKSVHKSAADVVGLSKLAEGGFNRTFVVTLRDGQQIVARIPYHIAIPKYYLVASEVATIKFMRFSGIPAPEIYGYSADADNAAGTPYILMELVQGSRLSEVLPNLDHKEVISLVRELTQIESRMMSLYFPAGGSLYFSKDLEQVAPGLGIPLDDKRFCVGPDLRLPFWYGRRQNLDVYRGPYQSAEAVLKAAAQKELTYLEKFGQPILPMRRERRSGHKFQQQSPAHHVKNLQRYLDISSSLVPSDPDLARFCIRHPDLQHNNIIVSKSPGSGWKVSGLIDFQHAAILPMFLLAGIPQCLQNYHDKVSQSMVMPSLPANFDELTEDEQVREEYLYHRRLVHYHYVASTKECNQLHYAAFTDPLYALRGRLYQQAGAPWEGETVDLKNALIQATQNWEELTGGGEQCPVQFDEADLRATIELNREVSEGERTFEILQNMCGIGEEGWVQVEDHEKAMAFLEQTKKDCLALAESEEEREEILTHWPWDDMDETPYM